MISKSAINTYNYFISSIIRSRNVVTYKWVTTFLEERLGRLANIIGLPKNSLKILPSSKAPVTSN